MSQASHFNQDYNDGHKHIPWKRTPFEVLQQNVESGCPACVFVLNALESFHGEWIYEQAAKLEFHRVGLIGQTPIVALNIENCDSVPIYYKHYKSNVFAAPSVELAFQVTEPTEDNFGHRNQHLNGDHLKALEIKAGRQLPTQPLLNIELMKQWIGECIAKHVDCQVLGDSILPKRALRIGTLEQPEIRLEQTGGQTGHYTALSHRWGVEILLTTTRDTIVDRERHIDWASLSKTFQDAITLTRLLGIEHIWIDSLCIIQDDVVDWQIESSKMAAIYENSYVTIAANTTFKGFLEGNALRPTRSVQVKGYDDCMNPLTVMFRNPCYHGNFYASSLEGGMLGDEGYPLSQRAWCFQERLLATRVLQFTDFETVFECKTGQHCECGTISHGFGTPIKKLLNQILREDFEHNRYIHSVWDGWTMILRPYITKDITYPADILPALAGLASRMQSKFGRYVSGLWENELLEGLFWFADVAEPRKNPAVSGPTFSWTSTASRFSIRELTFPFRPDDSGLESLLTVLDVKCLVEGLNPYGFVSSASISLRGPILKVSITLGQLKRGRNATLKSAECEEIVRFWIDQPASAIVESTSEYVCLFGWSWIEKFQETKHLTSALVMKYVANRDVYERVGCVPHLNNAESWLKHTSIEELVIV